MHDSTPRPSPLRFVAVLLASAAALLGAGCATTSSVPFLWVDDYPAPRRDPDVYRIAARDVISVRVWNQADMSLERARVREDGRISLPFLKDVNVAGMTPNELGEKLQRELVNVIVDPIVTVTLDEPALLNISVLGEVTTPATVTMPPNSGVLHAIAAAGGLTEYAVQDGIYVLRRLEKTSAAPIRIRFRYRDLTSGGTPAAGFVLQSGDVVVVE